MPPVGDDSRCSRRDTPDHRDQRWRVQSERKSGNDGSASGNPAGGACFSEPISESHSIPKQDREPSPHDTSPVETQNTSRSLLQKTKRLAYNADVGEHVLVLLNRHSHVEHVGRGLFLSAPQRLPLTPAA